MYYAKSYITIAAFFIMTMTLFVVSQKVNLEHKGRLLEGNQEEGVAESYFFGVRYYIQDQLNPFIKLKSSYLKVDQNNQKTYMNDPVGTVYTETGEPIHYRGEKGIHDKANQNIFLEGDVFLNSQTSEVKSDQATYDFKKEEFVAIGNVRSKHLHSESADTIYANSNKAITWPSKDLTYYEGSVKGKIERKFKYLPNIDYEANKLWADFATNHVRLEGDVFLQKQQLKGWSRRAELFLEKETNRLKYYALYDDVKLIENITLSDGSTMIRKAFGEKLEGKANEEKVILTGYPKVLQQSDVIKGNVITIYQNNEIVEVDEANSSFIIKD